MPQAPPSSDLDLLTNRSFTSIQGFQHVVVSLNAAVRCSHVSEAVRDAMWGQPIWQLGVGDTGGCQRTCKLAATYVSCQFQTVGVRPGAGR